MKQIILAIALCTLTISASAQTKKISNSDFTLTCNCDLEQSNANPNRKLNDYSIIEHSIGGLYSIQVKGGNSPNMVKSYLQTIKNTDSKIKYNDYLFNGHKAILGKYTSYEQGTKMYFYSLLFFKGDKFYTVMIGALSASDLEKVFSLFKKNFR